MTPETLAADAIRKATESLSRQLADMQESARRGWDTANEYHRQWKATELQIKTLTENAEYSKNIDGRVLKELEDANRLVDSMKKDIITLAEAILGETRQPFTPRVQAAFDAIAIKYVEKRVCKFIRQDELASCPSCGQVHENYAEKRKCVQDGGPILCDYQRPCDDHRPNPYRRGDDVSDDAMMG